MPATSSPTVVLAAFNAPDDLDRCLRSLARWPSVPVVVVDDASTDPRVPGLLGAFAAARGNARIVSMPANGGFIAAANRAAREVPERSDLLLLNADTEVTTPALGEMLGALERRQDAAIVCPMSNNATFLSVPRYQQQGPLPDGIDAERFAALLAECARSETDRDLPTAVGFCMLVRASAWRTLGPLDRAYGRGYGEDDDLAQRARAAGHAVVCAPRAFVFHRGHASFGKSAELDRQRLANGRLLASRWPGYAADVAAFCRANPLRALHERLWHALLSFPERREAHILHVVSEWPRSGGVRERVMGLARATRSFANHTVLVPIEDRGALVDAIDGEVEPGIRSVGLPRAAERFARFLACSPAGLVHFHGPEWRSSGAPELARASGRAILVTGVAEDPAQCILLYREARIVQT